MIGSNLIMHVPILPGVRIEIAGYKLEGILFCLLNIAKTEAALPVSALLCERVHLFVPVEIVQAVDSLKLHQRLPNPMALPTLLLDEHQNHFPSQYDLGTGSQTYQED